MTEIALKLFKFPAIRILRVSPLVPVALLPMLVLAGFILVILWVSFQTGVIGTAQAQYTLDNYRAVFADPLAYGSLLNTLVFAASTTFFAMAIGLPIAWLAERTTIGGKPIIYGIMTMGLLIPGIFVAMGWTFIAHPRIGFLNQWLVSNWELVMRGLRNTVTLMLVVPTVVLLFSFCVSWLAVRSRSRALRT
jgi:iron(III) transport system permease protein